MVGGLRGEETPGQQVPESAPGGLRGAGSVLRYLVGGACLAAVIVFSMCFTVSEGSQGVVLRFGKVVRVSHRAGLYAKAPWPIERVQAVDCRSRWISTPPTELLTRDRKNILLVTGAAWRPRDVVLFHRAIGSSPDADDKINSLIVNAKIAVFGRYALDALVSTNPQTLHIDEIEQDVRDAVNEIALSKYGVEVSHVGFQRVSLPEQNIQFVLEQMRAERRQFAAQFRAEGQLEAARVRSAADLEAAKILARAEAEAMETIGQAEAQAAQIYSRAYRADPDLYYFVRALDSLHEILGANAAVTLRTDASPFSLLVDHGSDHAAPALIEMRSDASLDLAARPGLGEPQEDGE